MTRTLLLCSPLIATALMQAHAAESASKDVPDKSSYWLLNPTPTALMRELSTDRPDKTESPNTVDAGHFQIEMDLVNWTHDHSNVAGQEDKVDSIAYAPINLKAGLCNRADLQLVLSPYTREVSRDITANSPSVVKRGFGDVVTRLKVNFWGNEGGTTAFAAMPYLKIPTNHDQLGNQAVEGGLILPLGVSLPGGWEMGLMTQFDYVRNASNDGYHNEYVNSVTLSHDIFGKLGGYVEFWSLVSAETGSDWEGSFDMGLTYGITDNIQLDGGVNVGVTESADDLQPFLGISLRF